MESTPTLINPSYETNLVRGVAFSQLAILKRELQLGGINVGERKTIINPNCYVVCKSCFGIDTVEVFINDSLTSTLTGEETQDYPNIKYYDILSDSVMDTKVFVDGVFTNGDNFVEMVAESLVSYCFKYVREIKTDWLGASWLEQVRKLNTHITSDCVSDSKLNRSRKVATTITSDNVSDIIGVGTKKIYSIQLVALSSSGSMTAVYGSQIPSFTYGGEILYDHVLYKYTAAQLTALGITGAAIVTKPTSLKNNANAGTYIITVTKGTLTSTKYNILNGTSEYIITKAPHGVLSATCPQLVVGAAGTTISVSGKSGDGVMKYIETSPLFAVSTTGICYPIHAGTGVVEIYQMEGTNYLESNHVFLSITIAKLTVGYTSITASYAYTGNTLFTHMTYTAPGITFTFSVKVDGVVIGEYVTGESFDTSALLPGVYTIVGTIVSQSDGYSDYTGYEQQILTITKLKPVITWPDQAAIYQGTSLEGITRPTANVPGTFTYTFNFTDTPNVNSGLQLGCTFTPTNTSIYEVVSDWCGIVILARPLTFTGTWGKADQFTWWYSWTGGSGGVTGLILTDFGEWWGYSYGVSFASPYEGLLWIRMDYYEACHSGSLYGYVKCSNNDDDYVLADEVSNAGVRYEGGWFFSCSGYGSPTTYYATHIDGGITYTVYYAPHCLYVATTNTFYPCCLGDSSNNMMYGIWDPYNNRYVNMSTFGWDNEVYGIYTTRAICD